MKVSIIFWDTIGTTSSLPPIVPAQSSRPSVQVHESFGTREKTTLSDSVVQFLLSKHLEAFPNRLFIYGDASVVQL